MDMKVFKKSVDYSLCVIIDQDWIHDRDILLLTEDILSGGATMLQYRNKSGSGSQFFQNAKRIHRVSVSENVPLIINDRVDIAMAVGADGVHLGQQDLPISEARKIIGPDALMGMSVSHPHELDDIQDADYLGVGAMFSTKTKPNAEYGGLKFMKHVRENCSLPLVGIGGIDEKNADRVIRAGADGVAVISFILGAREPVHATKKIRSRIQQTKQEMANA
jgi:thiamine-phosphate pyrophosphorylase